MAVYELTRYPRSIELRDGTRLALRPMTREDGAALLQFFHRIPEDERFFLKDDVTSPKVIGAWTAQLDYDRALPLLALIDGRVVADATLIRRRGNARAHAGEVRIVVDPAYRDRGLGLILMRELAEIAYDAELDQLVFELVADVQAEAIAAAKDLDAIESGRVTELIHDQHGHPHDLVFYRLPLGKWWEWSRSEETTVGVTR